MPDRTAAADVPSAEISAAREEQGGVLAHHVQSDYQSGETLIKVLLPDAMREGQRYPVLYVLPVEEGEGTRWGNALDEVRRHDLHNRHGLICVYPTFSHLPWYADHPTDREIRQETYLLRVVIPFVDRTYPVSPGKDGRLLVGFSKSGSGAFSLLLRHPGSFGKAAAWDAPLMEMKPHRFGMGPIFGTQENFDDYCVSNWFQKRARCLAGEPRLILTGYGNFRTHHVEAHERMTSLGIPHVYRDGPQRRHSWGSGWLPEAVRLLVSSQRRHNG
jgi:S-formylglutathione hydrolase FrmB